jgi:hypothetical protein
MVELGSQHLSPLMRLRCHPAGGAVGRVTFAVLALLAALGFALRSIAGRNLGPIVDELFSLLGAQSVAQRGVPLLPSGVLYLHGAVHSYLLAPLVAIGHDSPADLYPLRLVSAIAGAIAIVLTFSLSRIAGATSPTALFAAALVAIDPASVLWGGYARMYALAQVLAIAVAILFLQSISAPSGTPPGKNRATIAALCGAFWLAVFTHLATALLCPAMAAVAVITYGKDLFRGRRGLGLTLATCLLAPLLLIALTGAVGPGAGTSIAGRTEGLPAVSFLGDENVSPAQIFHPDPSPWTALFNEGPLALLAPLLLALSSGLLAGRFLIAPEPPAGSPPARAVGALLALYWLPILALSLFATDAAERYALFLLPTGYVLVALAVQTLLWQAHPGGRAHWTGLAGVALAAAMIVQGAGGSARLVQTAPHSQPPGQAAEAYVAAHRQPGELIVTSGAVDTALAMGRLPELRFLPGGEGSQRSLRYTRFTGSGQAIDYWIGMPSLYTTPLVCTALEEAPGSWLLISPRIWQNWGFNDLPTRQMERMAGPLRQLIHGLADQVYADDDYIVFRSRPSANWSHAAVETCQSPTSGPKRDRSQKSGADGNGDTERAASP